MASGIWHLACQTYALNLIDSHSGQNRAPQLFSSPKSFRVAKSTPSLATSSAKLSPISKWLSKPPLLFKSPLLSKSALVLAPLLLLSYTQDTEALTAQTSRVIEGSAPYLTFDGGQTKATDTNNLLYIELPDGRTITPSTNTSSSINPIMVSAGITFNDIHMVIPSGAISTSLDSLISQGKWGDDDGDGQGVGGVTASGSIWLDIKDKDGTTVSRSDALDVCKAPYKVTLTSTSGTLSTQYGVPRSSSFSGDSVDYYINPNSSQPNICYARPNLSLDTGNYAGPSNIWNPDKGFLVQSSYDLNFPTTGANGLYFDLDIGGIDASQLNWSVYTSGSISATVSWRLPNQNAGEDGWIRDKSKYVTRVTLHGPKYENSNSPVPRPSLPQAFELVGRDRSGNEVRYGFVLKQWLLHMGSRTGYWGYQRSYCARLGYSGSQVKTLTNAKCNVNSSSFPCKDGIDGATPSSGFNGYSRHIGAGFFTEWGNMSAYAGAGFTSSNYGTIQPFTLRLGYEYEQFCVGNRGGVGHLRGVSDSCYIICHTP